MVKHLHALLRPLRHVGSRSAAYREFPASDRQTGAASAGMMTLSTLNLERFVRRLGSFRRAGFIRRPGFVSQPNLPLVPAAYRHEPEFVS